MQRAESHRPQEQTSLKQHDARVMRHNNGAMYAYTCECFPHSNRRRLTVCLAGCCRARVHHRPVCARRRAGDRKGTNQNQIDTENTQTNTARGGGGGRPYRSHHFNHSFHRRHNRCSRYNVINHRKRNALPVQLLSYIAHSCRALNDYWLENQNCISTKNNISWNGTIAAWQTSRASKTREAIGECT
jgi:hypothetical protein